MDIEEVVADESALVSLSVSLVCVSLGFESDGEGSFGSLGPLESSPYVVSLPTLQRTPTDPLEDPLVGGLLQLFINGIGMQGKEIDGRFSFGNRNDTLGIGGKFQSMIPRPLPPQPGHPTMTGTTVVRPFTCVVSQ